MNILFLIRNCWKVNCFSRWYPLNLLKISNLDIFMLLLASGGNMCVTSKLLFDRCTCSKKIWSSTKNMSSYYIVTMPKTDNIFTLFMDTRYLYVASYLYNNEYICCRIPLEYKWLKSLRISLSLENNPSMLLWFEYISGINSSLSKYANIHVYTDRNLLFLALNYSKFDR